MDDTIYKKIFSENLRRLMSLNDKTQTDIINDLGFTRSAVSSWVIGTRLPRMDKVDALAQYFHCKRSDLIEDKPASPAPSGDAAQGAEDLAKIFEQYGTDTPEQRAALSAALNSLSLPEEKLELMRQVLRMDPDQAAAFLALAKTIVKTP